jgi:outer membrane protein TolC
MPETKRIVAVFLILGMIAAGSAGAQDMTPAAGHNDDSAPLVINADQAVSMALENNLQMKSARTDFEMKKLVRDTAWNEFLPSISAGATLLQMNEEQAALPIPGYVAPSQTTFRASVSLQLTLSLRNVHAIRKTVLDYESGLTSLVKAGSQLKLNVLQQFYGLLLTREQLDISRLTRDNAGARYNQAAVDFRRGLISEYDLLRTQVYWENAKPAVLELENALRSLESLFKLTLGVKPNRSMKLEGDLEVAYTAWDADKLIKEHLQTRFDILEARAGIDALQNGIDTAWSAFFPMLTFAFSLDPGINGPFEKDLFDPNNWAQQSGSFSISLRWMLDPLIPGSKTQNSITQLAAQKKLAEEQLLYLYQSAENSVRDKVQNLEKSKVTIGTRELNVRVAERAYALAQESYRSGGVDLLEVKDAEKDLLQAKLALLQEKFNYLKGSMELEHELNMDGAPVDAADKETTHDE